MLVAWNIFSIWKTNTYCAFYLSKNTYCGGQISNLKLGSLCYFTTTLLHQKWGCLNILQKLCVHIWWFCPKVLFIAYKKHHTNVDSFYILLHYQNHSNIKKWYKNMMRHFNLILLFSAILKFGFKASALKRSHVFYRMWNLWK